MAVLTSTGITFGDGTTQASGSTIGAIGTYLPAFYANTPSVTTYAFSANIDQNIAGSSLRYNVSLANMTAYNAYFGEFGWWVDRGSGSSSLAWASGGTALAGTWKCISRPYTAAGFTGENNQFRWGQGIWVRVS